MFNWLSLFTGLHYIALGIMILIYTYLGALIKIEPNFAYMLGSLIVAYGIFRVIRALYKIKSDRDENED